MKRFFKYLAVLISLLTFIYFVGPKAPIPNLEGDIPVLTSNLEALEKEIKAMENEVKDIRPNNEAQIVWYDSTQKKKTPYSIVYLHGYSASQGEGDPIHKELAKRYACNLYLSRLYGHGITTEDAMIDMTPEKLLASARHALAVGQQLGEKVILMSCSTGSTLAIYMASQHPDDIHALINYSPNIEVADPKSFMLIGPWGLELTRLFLGGNHRSYEASEEAEKFWTNRYRIEAVIAMKALVNATMKKSVFEKVKQPLFLGYYYKDEEHQDQVVSVPHMLQMFDQINTPVKKKKRIAFATVGSHILASKYWSKDIEIVKKETFSFVEKVLGLTVRKKTEFVHE